MSWIDTYDAVFFISIAGIVVGCFGLIIRTCLRSKCEHFSLCFGLIKIDRRVDLEVQEEMHALDLGVNDTDQPTQEQTQQPTQPIKQPPQTQVKHQVNKKIRRPSNEESDISDNIDLQTLNKI